MANRRMLLCPVCGQNRRASEFVHGELVRESVVEEIQQDHPAWTTHDSVCLSCLNRYRAAHVARLLEKEKGELSAIEQEVVRSLGEQELVSENLNAAYDETITFGERLSDGLASFGGSWRFLIIFGGILVCWIAVNSVALLAKPFDPFPYILLNLVLSCLAAIQAPVIMMSQNRQEDKDRLRAEHDYRINLKAELEVRLLHTKLDQLLTHQWQRLLEIQQLQIDLMEELAGRK
jgi:uncharacterized membrane protein